MLLQTLKEYAEERMPAPPPANYNETPIAYVVEIDGAGRPVSRQPTPLADPASPKTRRGARMLAPEVVRSSAVTPFLFADHGEYTFGLARDPAKQQRADACHAAYRALVEECAERTGSPLATAVREFLAAGGVTLLDLPADYDIGAKVTFRVHRDNGESGFPMNDPAIQAFWAAQNDPESLGAVTMQCITCGQARPALRVLPKVKGIRSGQSSGTSIISANAPAFESYGLTQSNVAPTCASCGEKFTRALNSLIEGRDSHLNVAGSDFVFWTRAPATFSWNIISDPERRDVEALLASVRAGKPISLDDDAAFYAVALSGSGGRTVVRDWIDTTVGKAGRRIARWFQLQRIVDNDGGAPRPLGVYALALGTVRDARDLPLTTPRAIVRAAFAGTPIPISMAFEAVRRNRAEQAITRPRAALIKLALLSNEIHAKEDFLVALEHEQPDIGYQCGRLLAVLEEVQRAALPNINANIVDRFFGTASSAPASAFARLLRGAQPHLSKLERDRPAAYFALQGRLEEVLGHIPGGTAFPSSLTLRQQALFSLGYYHQRAYDRAQAAAARAARENPTTDQDMEDSGD